MRRVTFILLVAAGNGCTSAPSALTEAQQRALADSATTLVTAVVANFDNLNMAAVFKDYSADPDARYLFNDALYPSLAAYQKDQEALGGSLEYAHTTRDAWDAMVLGPEAALAPAPVAAPARMRAVPRH